MKITKYGHACFTAEESGKMIVVDPGNWTNDLGAPENVVGIVITHEHADHFDPAAVAALIAHNPDAVVIGHGNVTGKLDNNFTPRTVAAGDVIEIGPFTLEFFGNQHATIHSSIPPIPNLGVMINDTVYYPGDSFTIPDKPVNTLVLPVSAPWLKISETMDFLLAIKPRLALPTHDAILSDTGQQLVDRMLASVAKDAGSTYQRLREPIDI